MKFQHQSLANGRWQTLSLFEQMANIGSEVSRAISWINKGNKDNSERALVRALELLYLTIAVTKKGSQLRELTRLKELLIDYFYGSNEYKSSDELWEKYFYAFTYAARNKL
ncbi:hypothetical protein HY408_00415 [Candidatus Gottesmanbacteria bacterium]|nr:hypothetical protein [Candidatus Gottesmanbacteria bacterium]